jgi:hypothetical protein
MQHFMQFLSLLLHFLVHRGGTDLHSIPISYSFSITVLGHKIDNWAVLLGSLLFPWSLGTWWPWHLLGHTPLMIPVHALFIVCLHTCCPRESPLYTS